MLARGWRRGPLPMARTSWLQASCMMLSSSAPPKTKSNKPYYSIEKQHLVLQVLQAMHDDAGRPNPFSVKALLQVPYSDKYPSELHKSTLKMTKLRSDKRENRLDAEVVAKLDAMGFVWDLDEHRWSQNKWALETYKALHGNLLVPTKYKISTKDPRWPQQLWTKRLGNVVTELRRSKAKLAPELKQWLDAMEFVWDGNEARWQSNLKALQTYKAIYGDVLVVQSFIVPTDDPVWPQDVWGLKLGFVVSNLRSGGASLPPERRDALNAMGFVWRLREPGDGKGSTPVTIPIPLQLDFVQVVQAQLSQQLHSKFVTLPANVEVPDEDPWPPQLRKSKFFVSEFRWAYDQGRLELSVVAALDALGFVWNVKSHKWNLKMEALTIYKTLHHDLLVRQDFSIPHDDPAWPVYLWGKKLGHVVSALRQSRETLPSAEEDQLDSMGFVWDAKEAQWQLYYKGLETFKALHGHVNIHREFIVPSDNPAWPPKLWNIKLGIVVAVLRTRMHELSMERREALDALDFEWTPLDTQWERIFLALETFHAIHGHLNIPLHFVVPEDDPLWPRDLWHEKLGYAAKNIQQRSQEAGYPSSRLAQLTEIGFFPAEE